MSNRWASDSAAGDEAIELIEQSAVRRRQQFPGNRAEEWRRHKGGGDQRADGLPAGHVGARHQPSHGGGDQAADDGRTRRDDRGRQQRIKEVGIGEQRDEVLQRHMIGLVGEAVDRKPRHRQHDQNDHERREQPQHRLGPVDFGSGSVDGSSCCNRLSPSFLDSLRKAEARSEPRMQHRNRSRSRRFAPTPL